MTLKVYNTLTRKKEEFKPRDGGKVVMYVCGPTVYNYIHIGNARCYVAFDAIQRYLKYKGYEVKYARNITDIDDKIIKRAEEEEISASEVANKYTLAFSKDMDALGVEKPWREPKATEHISEMIKIIETLIRKGYAYMVDGDVFYEVSKFKDYGKLSRQTPEEMEAGARIEIDERKRDPLDFALWKRAKPGEPRWPSPWGEGRPGWHIECSTMSLKYLEMGFDIHGGGQDLIFPHHENEIAQSEGYAGIEPFVKYWLHNGFLQVKEEKMAKSVGNVILIKDLREKYRNQPHLLRNSLRMLFLSTHYRSPLDFSDERVLEAQAACTRIEETLLRIAYFLKQSRVLLPLAGDESTLSRSSERIEDKGKALESKKELAEVLPFLRQEFEGAMDDDFNTAQALGVLFKILRKLNVFLDKIYNLFPQSFSEGEVEKILTEAKSLILELTSILGFEFKEVKIQKEIPVLSLVSIYQKITEGKLGSAQEEKFLKDPTKLLAKIIEIREEARREKKWDLADDIRRELKELGVRIEDTPFGAKIS